MTRSFLALCVLTAGFLIAAAVLVLAALAVHGLLAVAAFCLVCVGIARGLNSLLADDRPAPVEAYSAEEGWGGMPLRRRP